MTKLAGMIARQLRWMLACFVACVLALAGASLWGLSLSTSAADSLYSDKLQTVQATAAVSDAIHNSYQQAAAVLTTTEPIARQKLAAKLFSATIPTADVRLDALRRLPTIDTRRERALMATLSDRWAGFRNTIVPDVAFLGADSRALLSRLETEFAPIDETVARLLSQEHRDSTRAAGQAKTAWTRSVLLVLASATAALLAATTVVVRGGRRFVERAVAHEAAQQEFSQTMQLATNEDDAYRMITRHLERIITMGRAVVLNRNNSTDRLEAMTAIPSDWPLAQHLDDAQPRPCAAVRTARTYQRDTSTAPLLNCDVCGECPRPSICTPITVGGEIIGSVLVERNASFDHDDAARIVQSVAQGAPVLANLRNLALAELRAVGAGNTSPLVTAVC